MNGTFFENLKQIIATLASCLVALVMGCVVPQNDASLNTADADESDNPEEIASGTLQLGEVVIPADAEPLDKDAAYDIATSEAGVKPELLVYVDQLPYVISDVEAEMTWGFIEKLDDAGEGDNPSTHFRVTYLDLFDGSLIAVDDPAPENIMAFLHETGLIEMLGNGEIAYGDSPNSYDSYPWGWRLPFDSTSNAYMTCGHGCGGHTGLDYYATDWDPGNAGHPLESAASCWLTYAGYAGDYGYQVVMKCGDAGGGKSYGFRAAHMKSSPPLTPGWWIAKGRYMGDMGRTGNASGDHVHFVTYKGTISGGTVSGTSLPINKWPASADSICDKQLAGYNFYGGGVYPYLNIGATNTNGCK